MEKGTSVLILLSYSKLSWSVHLSTHLANCPADSDFEKFQPSLIIFLFPVTQLTWSHSPFPTLRTRIHGPRYVFMFLRITCILFLCHCWLIGTKSNSMETTHMDGSRDISLKKERPSINIGKAWIRLVAPLSAGWAAKRNILSFKGSQCPPLLSESTEFPRPSLLWYFWILP